MTASALRSMSAAVGLQLVALAAKCPDSRLCAAAMARARTWLERAQTITPENAYAMLRGYEIREVSFDAQQAEAERALADAGQSRTVCNETFLVRLDGELLGTPPQFEDLVATSKFVHFHIQNCLGGSWSAADKMLTAASVKPCSVHVAERACSAAGLLATLCPGRRTMRRDAELMLHAGTVGVFGGARELRRQAAELDKGEDALARRLAARTGKSVRWCRRLGDGRDYVFDAHEAKRHGLIDEVV